MQNIEKIINFLKNKYWIWPFLGLIVTVVFGFANYHANVNLIDIETRPLLSITPIDVDVIPVPEENQIVFRPKFELKNNGKTNLILKKTYEKINFYDYTTENNFSSSDILIVPYSSIIDYAQGIFCSPPGENCFPISSKRGMISVSYVYKKDSDTNYVYFYNQSYSFWFDSHFSPPKWFFNLELSRAN